MRRVIRGRQLVDAGQMVLVAVSGGADSVALLRALADASGRLRAHVVAAHFDHRLRGAASTADAAFVRDLCARLGLQLVEGRAMHPDAGAGLEARARRQRYEFLEKAADDVGAARIATAHTLDDQAETVLMRWLRGGGGDGLQAIRYRRGRVIRPLLDCSRAEVIAYLARLGQDFRDDESNLDRRFLRNRVRHELLPFLAEFNPRAAAALARTATVLQDEGRYLDRRVTRRLREPGVVEAGALSIAALRRLPAVLRARAIRRWLAAQGLAGASHAHVQAILALARRAATSPGTELPGGFRVERVGGWLRIGSMQQIRRRDG